jgi:hypothetical protein
MRAGAHLVGWAGGACLLRASPLDWLRVCTNAVRHAEKADAQRLIYLY